MHVALIPDGNRRYSREKNISLKEGYTHGKEKASELITYLFSLPSIKYITLWVLSKSNLSRPREELEPVLEVLLDFIRSFDVLQLPSYNLRVIGDSSKLPYDFVKFFQTENTIKEKSKTLILAINYCGQDDIRRAVSKHPTDWENHLDTAGIPNPDIIIRTGKEVRLSNFMNFQSGNSALYFLDKYWPDVTKKDIQHIIKKKYPIHKLKRPSGL